jgi:hypothetical protein
MPARIASWAYEFVVFEYGGLERGLDGFANIGFDRFWRRYRRRPWCAY